MTDKEISYKNEKLTKRLLELKSEKHKLSIRDKFKLKLLKKYSVHLFDLTDIDNILFEEHHIRYSQYNSPADFEGFNIPIGNNPYITEHGLNALKNNYYPSSQIRNKLKTPRAILSIISIILIIITSSIKLILYCSSNKSNDKIDKHILTIDSSKVKTKKTETIAKNMIKNNTNDTLYIKSKDTLDIKYLQLNQNKLYKIDSTTIKNNRLHNIKK